MRCLPVLLSGLLAMASPPVRASQTGDDESCRALARVDFAHLPGAPTRLESAVWRPGGAHPAACHVTGVVNTTVAFEVWLPAAWNSRLARVDAQFAHLGCSGAECGEPVSPSACEGVLARGFACLTADLGARARASDTAWLSDNPRGALDLAFRATHLATVAAKAVVRRRYGREAAQAYFLGCSEGGRQGLVEAQRFPADYDGVVAGAPPLDPVGNDLALLWNISALLGGDGRSLFPAPDGGYRQPDLRLMHRAVLAQCDLNDGVKDAIVGDPRLCRFDPGVLRCKAAKTPGCLTADQVAAVRKVLGGPRDSHGRSLYPARALPGSEVNWGYSYLSRDGGDSARRRMVATLLGDYALSEGPPPDRIDWDSLPGRVALQRALYDATNPDLRAFKARGGKLILYQGWSDHEVLPEAVTAYADSVQRAMGGPAQAASFMRLFMTPGMDHCGNGAAADKVDYLAALDAWVRGGRPPDRLVAARVRDSRTWPGDADYWTPPVPKSSRIAFTRPLYPYPTRVRYSGSGNPDRAESFVPVRPSPGAGGTRR